MDSSTERIHLTDNRVRGLRPEAGKTRYIFDDDPKQLCVRVTESGARAYVFRGKIGKESIRITIGDASTMQLDDARADARRLKNLVDQGVDPRELEREKAESKAAEAKAAE